MPGRYAESLILVWRLAELEARFLKSSNISPGHLLLGICKCVDVDVVALLPNPCVDRNDRLEDLLKETRQLRELFGQVGFDAKAFRRTFRPTCMGTRSRVSEATRLPRTPESKGAFKCAEKWASISSSKTLPIHLLHSLLRIENSRRDHLMKCQGVNLRSLKQAVRDHLAISRHETTLHMNN
jgi:ATP-dependent Clp protease ATP-binding subunit ClpC